ncbi:glycosyltransferase [Conyzicola sp.]|uniref:glycosyltransferase n=1 Tax=Conyzicola sp. TaxID=1969404 RepID=UPI003989B5F5
MSQLIAPEWTAGADGPREPSATVRVVSIPAGHPYVRSVSASSEIDVLDDPRPDGAPLGQWWPPVALDPRWIDDHAADAHILHIHFGTESFSPERLQATLDAAHDANWPVVFTVHDLVHPQLVDQSVYERQLDVLVPSADALLTLTPGAAAEIARRWGRRAQVVAHPALLTTPPRAVERARGDETLRVGMHLKDLRSNIAAEQMVVALVAALDSLAADGLDAVGEIRMHRRVRDPRVRDRVREICRGSARIALVEHDRLGDDDLAEALAALDACVLPYGYGTHSGWLELCWDLGVPVAAPATGYYADQHPFPSVASFTPDPGGEALAVSLRQLAEAPGSTLAGTTARFEQLARRRGLRAVDDLAVATTHADLYRRLLATN